MKQEQRARATASNNGNQVQPKLGPKGILKDAFSSFSSSTNKKKVMFSSATQVRRIPNIDLETDPELAYAIWYSRGQFRDMKERSELLLDLLHHKIVEPYDYDNLEDADGSIIQNDDYCSIGLDSCYGQGREVADALQKGGRAAGKH